MVRAPADAVVGAGDPVHRVLRARAALEHPRHDQRGLRAHREGEGPAVQAGDGEARASQLAHSDRDAVRARLRRGHRRHPDPDGDRVRSEGRRLVRSAGGPGPRPAADHGRDDLRDVLHRALQRDRGSRVRVARSAHQAHLMAERLIEVNGLKVQFATEDGIVRAVDGVDFELSRGQVLGIVGESGSGKSVTAMTLLGLTRDRNTRFEGEVLYKGRNALEMNEYEVHEVRGNEMSKISQDPMTSLNPVYTVGAQISEAIRIHERADKNTARRRAVDLLRQVGIPNADERVDNYPHEFSGGMRQRAMIAMA